MSPHYSDQTERFLAGAYRETRMTDDQIGAHSKHVMHFIPGPPAVEEVPSEPSPSSGT